MRISITSLLLLYGTLASCAVKSLLQPIDDCDSQVSLFKDGKTYYYNYVLENTAVDDNNEERFLLDIKCDIQLDAIGKCQYVLNAKDCRLFKEQNILHEQSRSFSKQLAKNPVLFTMFQDNIDSVSAHEDENIALLNIKRGIIATFQTVHVSELEGNSPINRKEKSLQGICDVSFQLESQRTVKTEKQWSSCTLNDEHFYYGDVESESYTINEECRYHFNDDNDIYNVSCVEQSNYIGFHLTTFYPRFSRSLSLVKSTPLVEQTEIYLVNYRVTNINFEYEDPPKSNSQFTIRTVITMFERMVELSHSSIESESVWLFNDLVEILRSSINLHVLNDGIQNCWDSPMCQSAKTSFADRNRIHFGSIWRDALIQCGSTDCLEEFTWFVTESTAAMADVLSDEIMEDIYHKWLIEGSTDLEFIYYISDICHYKNHTLCYLALSSNIRRYWNRNYSDISVTIPKTIKGIVEKTIEPIKYCENATSGNSRLLLSLKMLSNIGELAEVIEPDLNDLLYLCAMKSTTDGLIGPVAVEALRRLEPSSKLYENLLNIIKNPSLQQESRVNAYLILVDKWSEKAADDIHSILKSEAIVDTIKTFIYSHIKAVLRAGDHVRIRLAEAFRTIVDNNTSEYFSYNADEKLVSKYIENGLYFLSPLTSGEESLYGYQWIGTNLYDGTSFFPSSLMNKLKLTLAGQEFDFQEVSMYSKGLMNIIELFLRSKTGDDFSVADSASKLKSLLSSQLNNNGSKFVFDKLDKRIEHKLKNIIEKLSASFNAKPSFLINSKVSGEEYEYADLSSIISSLQRSLKDHMDRSIYRKNIHLYNNSVTLATGGGLPLKFFNNIDLMIVTDSKIFDHESDEEETSVIGFNGNIYSSFAVVAETGSIVDIPGFIRKGYGDEYFAGASGAVVADVYLDLSEGGTKTVRLELPANSKQAIVLSHQYMDIEGNRRQSSLADKEKETSCYNVVKICNTRLYEEGAFLPQFYFNWELQTPETHPTVFLFKYASKENETTNSIHSSLSASSEGVKTFGQLLYYNYVLDKPNKIERANIGSELLPNFKIEAIFKNLNSDETTLDFRGSFTSDFGLNYHSQTTGLRFAEELSILHRYPDVKERKFKNVLGRFDIHKFVLSTPKGNFSIAYTKQQFPISTEYDLFLKLKCNNTDAANWLRDILQMPAVWEDSQTIKMTVYHETLSILDNFESVVPEGRTHSAFRFPKYKIEVDSQSSIVDEHSILSTLNLTSHSLPENMPQLSYKLSLLHTSVKDDSGVSTNKILATFSVPHLKWIFSLDHHDSKQNRGLVLKIQRIVNGDDANGHLSKSDFYSTISDLPPSSQEISFDFVIVQNEFDEVARILSNLNYTGFPWLNTKSDPTGNIQFKLETYVPTRTYTYDPINKHMTYSLRSSQHPRAMYGEYLAGVDLRHKLVVVDHSNASICQLMIRYPNIYPLKNHHDYIFNFSSAVYTHISQLNYIYLERFPEMTVHFSILAQSPEWNLLNLDLKHCVDFGNETFRTKHDLMDIEGKGTWDTMSMTYDNLWFDYEKFLTFNSKTIWIPTMRWKFNCESFHKCVVKVTFANTKFPPIFIVYQLSPGKTELAFTIYRNKIRRDIMTYPDDFIFKAVLSLIEPFTVVQTITVEPHLSSLMEATLLTVRRNLIRNAEDIILNSKHPIHKIYKHFVGISIEETFTNVEAAGDAMTELLTPDIGVTIGPVISGIMYSCGPVSHVIRKLLPPIIGSREFYSQQEWFQLIYSRIHKVFRQRPGPFPGYSSVVDIQLPFALKPTTTASSVQWNPKLFKYWKELREDKHVIHDVFYDKKYSRVALLIGNNAVRPFEGGLIKILQPHCPQLLALDVEDQLFIVYKQDDWLHVVLSDTHLQISYTKGQFIVDAAQHEFPYEHWTGEFSVIREGDLIFLNTNYHLKIICDVRDHYCVFYTNVWKFGKLYGLLGNNTDAVLAQQNKFSARDYFNLFTLTDPSHCTETTSHGFTDSTGFDHGCVAFDDWHPRHPTFTCYDKIEPSPYYDECRAQGRRLVTISYLAACGALDVPVNLGHHWDFPVKCDGDHDIDSEWREFWDRQLVDMVFIVDQSLDPTYWRNYSKGLTSLAVHITNEFERNSYSEIKFALFGLRGRDPFAGPTLYTIKSQIWGSAEEFSNYALSHLFSTESSYISNKGSGDLLDAIQLAMDTTSFTSQAARIIVLVTPQDPFDRIEVDKLYHLLETMNSRQTTLHTISHYKELPMGAFGIVENQLSKPNGLKTRIPTPPSGFRDLVPGYAARLALATKGAVWSLSHLESGHNEDRKEFLSEVSEAMVTRSQHFLNRYYLCTCKASKFLKPYSSCEFV